MSHQDTIKTWKWRITKAGYKKGDFAAEIGIPRPMLSNYLHGRATPSLDRFDLIEDKLKELGV